LNAQSKGVEMKGLLGKAAIAICLALPNLAMAQTQYEAENATRSGGANVNTNHAGYTGTGFVDGYFNSTTAQTVFNVSAPSAGSATITVRYAAGNGASSNTGLYVNGIKLRNITFNATASWATWSTKNETVTLNAGNNTIGLKADISSSACINLDHIVVNLAATTYSLTVTAGTGGTRTAPATSPVTVTQGAATTITVTPLVSHNFLNWTVTSGTAIIANATSPSTTVTLNSGNATVTANFAIKTYQLSVNAGTGGTRTLPATSPVTVNHGVSTNVSATPNTGFSFVNWTVTSGTASIANATAPSTAVTLVGGNATIQANFTASPVTHTLTMTNDGRGTTSPTGAVTVNSGVATPITATATSGNQFQNWTVTSGAATIASPTSASTSVTLTGNATIRANFTTINTGSVTAVTYAEISSPVSVTTANSVVLALPFTAPSAGHITVTVTGLYGTSNAYTHEQRGLESFITLNSNSGGSLSGFGEKTNLNKGAQYVHETAGFPVAAGANTVRLIVTPRTELAKTTYSFSKCKMTIVFSQQKL
jgi:Carbohydrate binding module (family 35)/Divergent InlB B-repeat domain